MPALSLVAAQEQFTATIAAVEDAVKFAFRGRLRRQEYEEALAEARAAAWSAWHGLIAKGKDPIEVGIHGIASNAIRYVKSGRRLGNTSCGRGAMDVFHRRAQAACDFKVISLDSDDLSLTAPATTGAWKQWLAEDNACTPADQAAFRIDFADWLAGLPARKRQMAELLAQGHETGVVARMLGVTPAAVSQARPWLEARWRQFQGQAAKDRHRAATP